jgi:N-methylhydantoinase B
MTELSHDVTHAAADPFDLEIFRYLAESVVDEVEINLTRTAYSPLIYEYKDYCVGVLTADFRLLTQSSGSLPIFLADLGPPIADAVEIIGRDRLSPGDIFLTNYASVAGQHLNNVIAASPLFDGTDITGYMAIRAHWADVGGIAPGSITWAARDIYQEGIQYRGLRVVSKGNLVPEVMATIQANTRMSEYVTGDLMAQVAGCTLGVRRWNERVARRWRPLELARLIEEQFDNSEKIARQRIQQLPDGEYSASCRLDDAGISGTAPLNLTVRISVRKDSLVVDLSGLPPQVSTPMNAGANGGALSAIRVAYKSLVAPNRPADEGLFRPLTVDIPPGRILSADGQAPLGHWNATLPTVIDLFLKAIGKRAPELVPAGHHATMGIFMFHAKGLDGKWWQFIDTNLGGWGGSAHSDGFSPLKTLFHGDNRDIPVEVLEARFPLRILSYGFRRDAAGAGKHRGGWGTQKVIEILEDVFAEFSMDRTLEPPWGLFGGDAGKPGDIQIKLPGTTRWVSRLKAAGIALPKGTQVRIRAAGGGGWGKPVKGSRVQPRSRDRAKVP